MDWLKTCGECKNNSQCCCFREPVFLSELDKKRIIEKTGRTDFIDRVNQMKKVDGKCVFYKENKCSINDFKPLDCRAFPLSLWTEGGRSKHISFFLDLDCPYSRKVSDEWIEETKKKIEKEIKEWPESDLLAYDFSLWK